MPQYGCGDRMPQQMSGTSAGTHHPSATQYPNNNRRDGRTAGEGTKGCSAAHKNCVDLGLRPAIFEVIDNRLTHCLGQWKARVRAALTTNLNPPALPVDITQAKMHDIARPKTQTRQQ